VTPMIHVAPPGATAVQRCQYAVPTRRHALGLSASGMPFTSTGSEVAPAIATLLADDSEQGKSGITMGACPEALPHEVTVETALEFDPNARRIRELWMLVARVTEGRACLQSFGSPRIRRQPL